MKAWKRKIIVKDGQTAPDDCLKLFLKDFCLLRQLDTFILFGCSRTSDAMLYCFFCFSYSAVLLAHCFSVMSLHFGPTKDIVYSF